MNQIDLRRRTAVVTGGAQGIGLAVAKRLVASGATVALWDRDEKPLKRAVAALKGAGIGVAVDVADWTSVQAATDTTVKQLRKIDILVNNAGISGKNAPTIDYPVEEWQRVLAVNLNGVFHCAKALAPLMVARRYGRIVNMASVAGKEGNPNAPAYSASKAAVMALTKSLGKELAQTGVVVNALTPAAARTAIFDQMTPAHVEYMLSKIPMNRFVKVEEIAALVAWLASEECSFSTGAVFDISGGRATY